MSRSQPNRLEQGGRLARGKLLRFSFDGTTWLGVVLNITARAEFIVRALKSPTP